MSSEPLKVGDLIVWEEDYGDDTRQAVEVTDIADDMFQTNYESDWWWAKGPGWRRVDPKNVLSIPQITTTTHPTGAIRESKEGKGRPDLLLAGFPRALMALSRHMDCELGRDRNWELGLPESSLVSSQFRHLLGYVSGVSEDTPEYNLVANVWNAMVLLEEYLRVQDGVMDESVLDVEKPDGH